MLHLVHIFILEKTKASLPCASSITNPLIRNGSQLPRGGPQGLLQSGGLCLPPPPPCISLCHCLPIPIVGTSEQWWCRWSFYHPLICKSPEPLWPLICAWLSSPGVVDLSLTISSGLSLLQRKFHFINLSFFFSWLFLLFLIFQEKCDNLRTYTHINIVSHSMWPTQCIVLYRAIYLGVFSLVRAQEKTLCWSVGNSPVSTPIECLQLPEC